MNRLPALAPLLLLACGSLATDADEDLLSSTLERELGTDPKVADSDGDGLLDGLEVHVHLTDPVVADSDGDGDPDGWEVEVGLDPLDAASKRYPNGWPHLDVATKRELQRELAPSLVTGGERIGNFTLRHPEAERVELYDFARDGRPIVLVDVGTSALSAFATWIELEESFGAGEAIGNPSEAVRDAVVEGSVRMILSWPEFSTGEPVSNSDHINFLKGFDVPPHVAILIDHGFAVWAHLGRRGLDESEFFNRSETFTFVLLDEDMIVQAIDDWAAVEAAIP
jgi:hypothetical protein